MMSTTTKINRVGYIGWRGIAGCEVLELHEELTGLIGGGGAGKSTLLMALDYALLPDRQAMNIRPISDLHDSHTSGVDSLAGRINPDYGYAYVVLDVTTRRDERLIAGVHIGQADGRASFSRWYIDKVPNGCQIQELMSIGDGDEIEYPDFSILRRHLAAKGVDVTICRGIGDYGQVLYDAGVLPSSMGLPADRTLYAKLIETTFKGGISQEVATRLKDYLLPEQSQVKNIVQGLQDCTNEVLKTRSAITDANRELALLKSTYGVGKDAVLTALRCIGADIQQADESAKSISGKLRNGAVTHQELSVAIPAIELEITALQKTRQTVLDVNLGELGRLEGEKSKLSELRSTRKIEADEAQARLSQFNSGRDLWRDVAGQHQGQDFDWIKQWLDGEWKDANTKTVEVGLQMRALQEEEARLSGERASVASEHLAEMLGAQSLEQALGHLGDKESAAYEMGLGGLVDGVVGVGIDALATLAPSKDIPDLFWLGETIPTMRPAHETGDWYVSTAAGGYMVASKHRARTFGGEARQMRRKAIAAELVTLSRKHTTHTLDADRFAAKKELLLTNDNAVRFYLQHRHEPLTISKAADDARKALAQCNSAYKAAMVAHSNLQDKIATSQAPYDTDIKKLQDDLTKKRQDFAILDRDIRSDRATLEAVEHARIGHKAELEQASLILGAAFNRLFAEADKIDAATKNIAGLQAQRIAKLGEALGDEVVARTESIRDTNSEDRLSVVRIWPDLMRVVREIVSIDLADTDGEDLIQEMQERRAALDGDLLKKENEVRINATNIFLNISTGVRGQRAKIEKLSRLGQTIEFGNVVGIQIKLVLRTRMMEILEQFADQLSLFSNNKPIDQVLKEFFEAASDGGIKMDGEHLLDYRNYVDLGIEVKRRDDEWKPASSLSGTESIGCGLAISLMLIRSIALRGEASGEGVKVGQIRPLFAVDELGRLNDPGQKLLVDFAKREQFQLVVTAPTMKPNYDCILYALTRHYDPKERLIIRGVRVKDFDDQKAA